MKLTKQEQELKGYELELAKGWCELNVELLERLALAAERSRARKTRHKKRRRAKAANGAEGVKP